MSNLNGQINKIIVNKLKNKKGETIAEQLRKEVLRLYDCIQYYIDEWYHNYQPKVYMRTGNLKKAMYAEDIVNIRVDNKGIRLSIRFYDDLAWHKNLWGNHESYVPMLMDLGWVAPDLEKKLGVQIPNFTRFDGIHFVERGIADFNRTNSLGIKIDVSGIYKGQNLYDNL